MSREIYLVVFAGNDPKPAHWAIWIPRPNSQDKGKVLHVTGNPMNGFHLEFKRNYDIEATGRKHYKFLLALVDPRYIRDATGTTLQINTTATDRIEMEALVVVPPGRQPNPFDDDVLNCQIWVKDFIDRLITVGYIPEDARRVLQGAPRFYLAH